MQCLHLILLPVSACDAVTIFMSCTTLFTLSKIFYLKIMFPKSFQWFIKS